MSIETRLRNTGDKPGGGGGSSNSGGLAGTDGLFVVYSNQALFPFSKILSNGANITLTTDATSILISATTGVAGASGGLAGTGVFYLLHTSGNATVPNSKRISAGSSITTHTDSTTFYINAITPTVSFTSAGLAGTGPFYLLQSSGNSTLPNSKQITAGSSVTLSTDATALYITALTNAATSTAGLAGTGGLLLVYSSQSLFPSSKVLTAGSSVTLTTDATAIYITAITPGAAASSAGLAGTGPFYLLHTSGNGTLPLSKVLSAGANITITTSATGVLLTATTGGSGSGVVNAGSSGFIAYYASNGTSVSASLISTSTGAGIAAMNFQALTSQLAAPGSGDFWVLNSAGLFLQYYINNTAFYTRLTHTDGSVSSSSGGLAGTGGLFVTYAADGTLSAERTLTAGSSVTIVTDATAIYINAITNAGAASATPGTVPLAPQQARLYSNDSAARIDAGTPFYRLLFSTTTQQYGTWSEIVPAEYSSNPYIRIYYGADSSIASARSISWIIQQWGIAANQGRAGGYYADTFGGTNTVSIALSAGYSSGTVQMLTVPLATTVSFAANRLINLRMSASGGPMGNVEMVEASLEYTKV